MKPNTTITKVVVRGKAMGKPMIRVSKAITETPKKVTAVKLSTAKIIIPRPTLMVFSTIFFMNWFHGRM